MVITASHTIHVQLKTKLNYSELIWNDLQDIFLSENEH